MTENKRYVRILDHSEKEVRIFDEHNNKNIFNIFFEGLDSAICLKGALEDTVDLLNELAEENQELKQLIKKLEKQIHLIHMSSMFSTVKSFKGDVSKRYKYSEETNTIYDTANKYGQYNKVLDKKEVVMLLNEYETLLESDDDNL